MFGIGLPELILILALALIVVGPDKLPDLARSVAKGILELKKTATTLKESLTEDGNPLDEIKPEIEKASKALTNEVLGVTGDTWSGGEPTRMPELTEFKRDEDSSIIEVTPEEDNAHVTAEPSETATRENQPETVESEQEQTVMDDSKTVELQEKLKSGEQQS